MPDYSEAKPMRLSEAIRLGSMLGPQCFKQLYDKKTLATCALGAAIQAHNTMGTRGFLEQRYLWFFENRPVPCPHCRRTLRRPVEVIVHLNDDHRWSRAAIADWVEELENRGVPDSEALSKQTGDLKSDHNSVQWMKKLTDLVSPSPSLTPVGWLDKLW